MEYRVAGTKITGINSLKDTRLGETAVICCAGTSLEEYDDSIAPRSWARFAVNAGISKLRESADYWVFSDDPIVHEYYKLAHSGLTILCMQQAVPIVDRFFSGKVKAVYTTESMSKPARYDNGFQFYSRGTVLIGAIEMARWIGFRRFFVFGLDCYRRSDKYYHDGRKPLSYSENVYVEEQRIYKGVQKPVYVTPKLKRMIEKLDEVKHAHLWDEVEVWCVNSPWSQQDTIQKMTLPEFRAICSQTSSGVSQPADANPTGTKHVVEALATAEAEENAARVDKILTENDTIHAGATPPELYERPAPKKRGRPPKARPDQLTEEVNGVRDQETGEADRPAV
jgi:hypothetical protein